MYKKYLPIIVALIIGLIAGFFVGKEYAKYTIAKAVTQAFTQPNNPESIKKDQEKIQSELKGAIEKKVGDDIELATIKIKINSSKEENIIQSSYSQPKVADQGTKFVIIDATVTNITKAPFNFTTTDLVLADDKNTSYTPYGDTIGNIDNYLDVQELSPNIPKTGVIVYQLPELTTSYSFVIGKAGTNETYRIRLK